MFQIGSVGSLLQDVVATTETVHTFAEALVYDVRALIPISQLVSHPRITTSIILQHFLADLKIRRTVFLCHIALSERLGPLLCSDELPYVLRRTLMPDKSCAGLLLKHPEVSPPHLVHLLTPQVLELACRTTARTARILLTTVL